MRQTLQHTHTHYLVSAGHLMTPALRKRNLMRPSGWQGWSKASTLLLLALALGPHMAAAQQAAVGRLLLQPLRQQQRSWVVLVLVAALMVGTCGALPSCAGSTGRLWVSTPATSLPSKWSGRAMKW